MPWEIVQVHKDTDRVAWIIWQPNNTWTSKYMYYIRKVQKDAS